MKKICSSFILIAFIGIFFIPAFKAEAIDNMDKDLIKYLKSDEGKKSVTEAIEKSLQENDFAYYGIAGNVEISKPFSIPIYNEPTESFYELQYERYSLCYCDDKPVGLVGFLFTGNSYMTVYYMLPDNFSYKDISLCFYGFIYDSNGNMLYGNRLFKTLLAVDKSKTEIVYYGTNDSLIRTYSKLKTLTGNKYFQNNLSELKKSNYVSDKMSIVCTISSENLTHELPEVFTCMITTAEKDKALTYDNGKFILTSISSGKSDNQIFVFRKSDNGYTISSKISKHKISVGKSTDINLVFLYHGKVCCVLTGKDGNVIKVKDGKAVFGNYDFWDSSCDWVLTEIA